MKCVWTIVLTVLCVAAMSIMCGSAAAQEPPCCVSGAPVPIMLENATQLRELTVLLTSAEFIADMDFCATGEALAVVETSDRYEGYNGDPGFVTIWDTRTWQVAYMFVVRWFFWKELDRR